MANSWSPLLPKAKGLHSTPQLWPKDDFWIVTNFKLFKNSTQKIFEMQHIKQWWNTTLSVSKSKSQKLNYHYILHCRLIMRNNWNDKIETAESWIAYRSALIWNFCGMSTVYFCFWDIYLPLFSIRFVLVTYFHLIKQIQRPQSWHQLFWCGWMDVARHSTHLLKAVTSKQARSIFTNVTPNGND